jgi:hypothetical protein
MDMGIAKLTLLAIILTFIITIIIGKIQKKKK